MNQRHRTQPNVSANAITRPPSSPEKRLLMAILMDAVVEFQEAIQAHERDEAELGKLWTWFVARDQQWPFSFENLCEHLDLDAGSIRSRLMTLASRKPATR